MTGGLRDRGSRARRVAHRLALGALLAPSLLSANSAENIEFSAPLAGCPGLLVLEQRVAELATHGTPTSHVGVVITATASGYHTEVTLLANGEPRSRTFDTETCEAGVEAAALVAALGSQSDVAQPAATNTSGARPASDVVPAPSAAHSSREVTRSSAPAARVLVRAAADLGLDGFALPRAAPLGRVGASLALGQSWWFEASALGAPPITTARGEAHFNLLGAALRSCYLEPLGRFAAGPCLGAGAYRIAGEGKVAPARSGQQLYGGPTAGALARWPLSERLAVRASVEGLVAFSASPFNVNGTSLYTPGKIDFSSVVGCDFRF